MLPFNKRKLVFTPMREHQKATEPSKDEHELDDQIIFSHNFGLLRLLKADESYEQSCILFLNVGRVLCCFANQFFSPSGSTLVLH